MLNKSKNKRPDIFKLQTLEPNPKNQKDQFPQKFIEATESLIISYVEDENNQNRHKFIICLIDKVTNPKDIQIFFSILGQLFSVAQTKPEVTNATLNDLIGKTDSLDMDISNVFFQNLLKALDHTKNEKLSKDDQMNLKKFIKHVKNSSIDNPHALKLISEQLPKNNAKPIKIEAEFDKFDNDKKNQTEIQILPTQEEILYRRTNINKIQIPLFNRDNIIPDIEDMDQILDRNFRLLREELIYEIEDKKTDRRLPLEDATFKNLKSEEDRLIYMFHFKRPKGKSNDPKFWSKRFGLDSLVNLIYDTVEILCSVSYRNVSNLQSNKPEIGLTPVSNEQCQYLNAMLSIKTTNGRIRQVSDNFLSINPILKIIQRMDSVPFFKEIWLNNIKKVKVQIKKEFILNIEIFNRKIVDIPNQFDSWVEFRITQQESYNQVKNKFKENTTLDDGQIESMMIFLQNPVVLVQGPPGTGKTFIGALMVEVLQINTSVKILTVTQTNHALDQFCMNLIERGINDLVRLGFKSKESEMEKQKATFDYKSISPEEKQAQSVSNNNLKNIYSAQYSNFEPWLKNVYQTQKDQLRNKSRNIQNQQENKIKNNKEFKVNAKSDKELSEFNFEFMNKVINNSDEELDLTLDGQSPNDVLENQQNAYESVSLISQQKQSASINSKRLIAATSVGCAKYNSIIRKSEPHILIIEEAGEVLESHILTSLFPSLKQVILIGDHKQLRPKVNCQRLRQEAGKGFDFNLSLLEQSIIGNNNHSMLTVQHRMHPEISKQVNHMYYDGKVKDSPKLLNLINRPMILGTNNRVQFIDHEILEDKIDEQDSSKLNHHSATFVVRLAEQFVNQNYSMDKITILTPYLGQLFNIMNMRTNIFEKLLDERDLEEMIELEDDKEQVENLLTSNISKTPQVRSATIDNYQGEESDIILLDLVRCNLKGEIGFLKEFQRMNVALSRAKIAMIIIGSKKTLTSNEDADGNWTKFFRMLEESGSLKDSFTAVCQRHGNVKEVKSLNDFNSIKNGGCDQLCGERRECGHGCRQICHSVRCESWPCVEPCQSKANGCSSDEPHKCKGKCNERCKLCDEKAFVVLNCGHEQQVKCHEKQKQDISKAICKIKVKVICKCCKKHQNINCCDKDQFKCETKCKIMQECGHSCGLNCSHTGNHKCKEQCNKPQTFCSHLCKSGCKHESSCPPCNLKCTNRCSHSICPLKCDDICRLCSQECDFYCPHQKVKCTKICTAVCDVKCDKRCEKKLACGHQCPSKCGEICPKVQFCLECNKNDDDLSDQLVDFILLEKQKEIDLNKTPIIVLDCGHIITFEQLQEKEDSIKKDVKKVENGNSVDIGAVRCDQCRSPIYSVKQFNEQNMIKFVVNSNKKFISALDEVFKSDKNDNHAKFFEKFSIKKDKKLIGKEIRKNGYELEFLKLIIEFTPQQQTDLNQLNKYSKKLIKMKHDQIIHYLKLWFSKFKNMQSHEKHIPNLQDLIIGLKNQSDWFFIKGELNQFFEIIDMLIYLGKRSNQELLDHKKLFLNKDIEQIFKTLLQQNIIHGKEQTLQDYEFFNQNIMDKINKTFQSMNSISEFKIDHTYDKIKRIHKNDLYLISEQTNLEKKFSTIESKLIKIRKVLNEEDDIMKVIQTINLIERWDKNSGNGHWISCPCGNIYVVADCGGANQRSICNNCGRQIGGEDHQFEQGNVRIDDVSSQIRRNN